MRTYAAELKDSIVARMLPPHNVGVSQLVRETGIPRDTLYGLSLIHISEPTRPY